MNKKIHRRSFGQSLLALPAAFSIGKNTGSVRAWPSIHHTSLHSTAVIIPGIEKSVKVLQISDAHISIQDESEKEFEQYGNRMHSAFKTVKHYETGVPGVTTAHFENLIQLGMNEKADLLALSGDILNYPSAHSVAFVKAQLNRSGLPHMYTAGNHDWHYEGMEGQPDELRAHWCRTSLRPLYAGEIYASSRMVGDVNVVMIDNSTYQVKEEQLHFFRKEKEKGYPVALIVHIPLFYPGMKICCGHPDWGWNSDRGFEIERRQRWPKSGNEKSTIAFVKEVTESSEVVGVFAGHWHRFHSVAWKGPYQHLALPAFSGHYRMIDFLPE